MILLECEDKGAYATIVTVECGGYCWRVKKKVRTPTYLQSGVGDIVGGRGKRCVRQHSYSRVWMILLEGEEKGAYANIVTVGCG